jgi:hypothetical protein
MISILDMKMKVLKNVNVSDVIMSENRQELVSWTMPSGIYVVKFKSKYILKQRAVTSLATR